jgi:hypothetical protein
LARKWRVREVERDFFVAFAAFMNSVCIITVVEFLQLAVTWVDLDLILTCVLAASGGFWVLLESLFLAVFDRLGGFFAGTELSWLLSFAV